LLEDYKTDALFVEIGGSVVLDCPIPAAVLNVLKSFDAVSSKF